MPFFPAKKGVEEFIMKIYLHNRSPCHLTAHLNEISLQHTHPTTPAGISSYCHLIPILATAVVNASGKKNRPRRTRQTGKVRLQLLRPSPLRFVPALITVVTISTACSNLFAIIAWGGPSDFIHVAGQHDCSRARLYGNSSTRCPGYRGYFPRVLSQGTFPGFPPTIINRF